MEGLRESVRRALPAEKPSELAHRGEEAATADGAPRRWRRRPAERASCSARRGTQAAGGVQPVGLQESQAGTVARMFSRD